jgi:hypothetical protein
METLFLNSLNDGFDASIINDGERREWVDDVTLRRGLLAPGNQDPAPAPGEVWSCRSRPNAVVVTELQQILDMVHDADFGRISRVHGTRRLVRCGTRPKCGNAMPPSTRSPSGIPIARR